MGLWLVGEVLDREGQEKMDMVALEVVGTAAKVDEVLSTEALLGLTTSVGLGVCPAVNGGGENDFQMAADIEVVAEVIGEVIEIGKLSEQNLQLRRATVDEDCGNEWLPTPLETASMGQSPSLIREPDHRLKQVPKDPKFSSEKADRSHFLSKKLPLE